MTPGDVLHGDALLYRCHGCGSWRWEPDPTACLTCNYPAGRKALHMTTEGPTLTITPRPWKPHHKPCSRCGARRWTNEKRDDTPCMSCRVVLADLERLEPNDDGWVQWIKRGGILYPVAPRPDDDEEWAS